MRERKRVGGREEKSTNKLLPRDFLRRIIKLHLAGVSVASCSSISSVNGPDHRVYTATPLLSSDTVLPHFSHPSPRPPLSALFFCYFMFIPSLFLLAARETPRVYHHTLETPTKHVRDTFWEYFLRTSTRLLSSSTVGISSAPRPGGCAICFLFSSPPSSS